MACRHSEEEEEVAPRAARKLDMGSDSPQDGVPPHSPHAEPHVEEEQGEAPSDGAPLKKRTGEEELPRTASVAEPAVADSDGSVAEVLSDGETASQCQYQPMAWQASVVSLALAAQCWEASQL